jgi:hypothetical protein
LVNNFLSSEAAEWYETIIASNICRENGRSGITFNEYWRAFSEEFTDFMLIQNTYRE